MHKNILVVATVVVVMMVGCAKGKITPSEIRADNILHSQLYTDNSIQSTVKNISDKRNECKPFMLSEYIVVLDEIGEARIEYRDAANRINMLVDLKKENNKTRVDIYSVVGSKALGWEKAFKTLEHGAKGLPGCPE